MGRILVRTGRVGQTIAPVVVVLHARALAPHRPEVNAEIDALVARGIAENAPITLMTRAR